MKLSGGHLQLTATDLGNFLACRRKTGLDYAVAAGRLHRPKQDDYVLEILRERGARHEKAFVQATRDRGVDVEDLSSLDRRDRAGAVAATLAAMRRGTGAIVQAALASGDGRWFGFADMLRRVEMPGALGAWSYEVLDTKLAQETHGATVLQLSMYSEVLAELQGVTPEFFHVVTPLREERYRTGDYAAYYRLMKAGLEAESGRLQADGPDEVPLPYPEPVGHCDICVWAASCRVQLRADDHLSFVAGSSRLQRNELATQGITTLAALGREGLPAAFRPSRGSATTYERLQHQARLQLAARESGAPSYELLPVRDELGLALLPEPSPGDVFLDLEGATWARDGGREYLFGLVTLERSAAPRDLFSALDDGPARPVYESFKAFTDAEERAAFEKLIDRLIEQFDRHPDMHVYHYGHYEASALKKLMGRYATRGPELDRLLRAERFVDLLAVVRHALRAGIERYSIKDLEQFYEFERRAPLVHASNCRRIVEAALDLGAPELVKPDEFETVRTYNRDDCVSALRLREWLEARRRELEDAGTSVPRPPVEPEKEAIEPKELEKRALELRARLLAGMPEDPGAWSEIDRAKWLLAYTTDWHSREFKAAWWEFYRLRDLAPEDLPAEPMAVAGLEFVERVSHRPVVDRYRFADGQEMEIEEGKDLFLKDETKWGEIVDVDRIRRAIDVQKTKKTADIHAAEAFHFFAPSTALIQESVQAFAADVVERGFDGFGPDARVELLLRRRPRLEHGPFALSAGEDAGDFAARVATSLDATVLAIQGPPGTGKTHTGARMIRELVKAKKKVGVLASSHKVIRNLLKAVRDQAAEHGETVRLMHRLTNPLEDEPGIIEELKPERAIAAVTGNLVDVIGGVQWTFASDKAVGLVDVLFVDEAGQMSLANVLGAARGTRNIVLLGDQQQLEQPRKASHPDGVDVSALDHMLGGRRTMPEGAGIFLPVTRRLSPGIATFTSEAFYEGRLRGLEGLGLQKLNGIAPYDTGALWVLPVQHSGNQGYSNEEVEAVAALVAHLAGGASWIDKEGVSHRVTPDDVLVVAPYNAQVSRLRRKFEVQSSAFDQGSGRPEQRRGANFEKVRIGTVDKFQGQEAPVVIYSLATSQPEDAPRGMEFLYSLNRLNVATSRAQCAVIVVASPALFTPACATPRQMRLANALCRYRELAGTLPAAP